MQLQCPACQKQLIIDDQYAGQMMKCPMCQATFTAPALPSYSAQASTLPAPSPGAPPMPPTAPAPPPGGFQPPAGGGFQPPGAPPGFAPQPAAPGAPAVPYEAFNMAARSAEPTKSCIVKFNPMIMQWIPVGAVFLIFILSFFTWVWIGAGSVAGASQNGWQAAFGGYSRNTVLVESDENPFHIGSKKKDAKEDEPGASVLTIFYVLLLILTLLLVIAAAAVAVARIALPANMNQLLGFRWAIVAGLCFLMFFFLTLQLLFGFSSENVVVRQADKLYKEGIEQIDKADGVHKDKSDTEKNKIKQHTGLIHGAVLSSLHRTTALTIIWWLNLIAFAVAGFIFWIDVRKTAPIPKLDFRY
jgi:hypothetical protein